MMLRLVLASLFLAQAACALAGADPEWAAIVAMDAGPGKKPATREEAQVLARTHLARQKRQIEDFLAKYPSDPRAFDAKLRLAGILAATGQMDGVRQQAEEAVKILSALETAPGVPEEKRADAGFRRACLTFQSLSGKGAQARGPIAEAARSFAAKYPGDKRGPRLLVEASTVCDADPAMKRRLLDEAQALSHEEALNHRIADDLVRLALHGRPLDLKFPAIQGSEFDIAGERGRAVAVVFWSAESPHSLMWMQQFRANVAKLPQDRLRVVTVSLDTNRKALEQRMKEFQIGGWPTHFDGRGWDNAIARPLGINALPTVFLADKNGILRSINARDDYLEAIPAMLRD